MIQTNILLLFFLFMIACTPKPDVSFNGIEVEQNLIITNSNENEYVYFRFPNNFIVVDSLINKELNKISRKINYSNILNIEDSSFTNKIKSFFENNNQHPYILHKISLSDTLNQIIYKIDSSRINLLKQNFFYPKIVNQKENDSLDKFNYIKTNQLLFPCPNIDIPQSLNLLPNAPRKYRSGTHQGIDFAGYYGSEVRNVYNGVVIRSDHHYNEVSNEFRNNLLNKASKINRTPSDIFVNILYGRTVMIDHGFDIIKDKRIISIYAHLSKINPEIKVGEYISRGAIIGNVGNSGTSDGAKGNKKSAHLHFELIIQDKDGERYLGKNIYGEELVKLLNRIFSHE